MDARTSDAIALALRFKCPIYTTEEILSKSGIVIDLEQDKGSGKVKNEKTSQKSTKQSNQQYRDMALGELEELLEEAVKNEEYEKASLIRDEIKRRKK